MLTSDPGLRPSAGSKSQKWEKVPADLEGSSHSHSLPFLTGAGWVHPESRMMGARVPPAGLTKPAARPRSL